MLLDDQITDSPHRRSDTCVMSRIRELYGDVYWPDIVKEAHRRGLRPKFYELVLLMGGPRAAVDGGYRMLMNGRGSVHYFSGPEIRAQLRVLRAQVNGGDDRPFPAS